MVGTDEVASVARRFSLAGPVSAVAPIEVGIINATFLVSCGATRYVVQRLNATVFGDAEAVLANVARVSEHVARKVALSGGRTLTLVLAVAGGGWLRDEGGSYWRCYDFLEGCKSVNSVATLGQAREAGRAFGEFLRLVGDLPAAELVETIPDFHQTAVRYERLLAAVHADRCGRAGGVAAELAAIRQREPLTTRFQALEERGVVRRRVVHNDTKINNVMFDEVTGKAVCVIDLDTVMPGLALHDFGDLVRSAANPAAEDERDLEKVVPRMDVFGALAEGFLAGAGDALSESERRELAVAPQVLALELAMRFLTDHLCGDVYFQIQRAGQNLDRCRAQLALLGGFEAAEQEMTRRIAQLSC
jgi:hypothetical protein